ncbi:hypothetical protein ES703_100241 [subsurface metagenome]
MREGCHCCCWWRVVRGYLEKGKVGFDKNIRIVENRGRNLVVGNRGHKNGEEITLVNVYNRTEP